MDRLSVEWREESRKVGSRVNVVRMWFAYFIVGLSIAAAQVTSGTIVVVGFAADKVIVAADSRGHMLGKPPIDDRCKIATFNHNIVFTSTGAFGHYKEHPFEPVGNWDNIEEAKTAAQTTPRNNDIRIQPIAEAWGKQLKKRWAEYNFFYPQKVVVPPEATPKKFPFPSVVSPEGSVPLGATGDFRGRSGRWLRRCGRRLCA
jgi:hypothetical protein